MIDIKFLRENPDIVKENIKKKFQDSKLPLVDEVIVLDADRRKAQQEADELKAAKNKIAKEIGKLMGQGKKEEAEKKAETVREKKTKGNGAASRGRAAQTKASAGKTKKAAGGKGRKKSK